MNLRSAFWTGIAMGAAVMYFFDPEVGNRRRRAVSARFERIGRRGRRRTVRLARHVWSEGLGAEQRLAHPHPAPAADDLTLADRIRSEIFRNPAIPKGAFNIEVLDGVAILRGQLATQQAVDVVVRAVGSVEGVGAVRNLMHLPGTVPSNKEAVLTAGG